jgi:hypothetical protein
LPKRYIDYEAAWASDKIAACSDRVPATSGVYYLWFYGLADANGILELTNPSVIHGKVAVNLPFLSVEDVIQILKAFVDHGLLFTWFEGGKLFGFWTKSDLPGRLPPKEERKRYKCLAANLPISKLLQYERLHANKSHDSLATASRLTHDSIAPRFDLSRLDSSRVNQSLDVTPSQDTSTPQAVSSEESEKPKPERVYEPGDVPAPQRRRFDHGSRKRNSEASGAVHAADPHKYDGLG